MDEINIRMRPNGNREKDKTIIVIHILSKTYIKYMSRHGKYR
jgi:hypothetical protein